jgi:hypothetical protein
VLLHRTRWSVKVPAWRAAERDEAAVVHWKDETWPVIKGRSRAWPVFEDEFGHGLGPPKGRAWDGAPPVVTVTSGSNS